MIKAPHVSWCDDFLFFPSTDTYPQNDEDVKMAQLWS